MSSGPGTVTVRCPACGQALRAVLATAPATQWFPCPRCHRPVPVVVPRPSAPLYAWEVYPGLYPPLPPPRRPRFRTTTVVAIALAAVAVLGLALAASLAYYGVEAAAARTYTVSGTVETGASGAVLPVGGARVSLAGEGAFAAATTTNAYGSFQFVGVPSGGVTLDVNKSAYANATLTTFVSPVYDAGSKGLVVDLVASSQANHTLVVLSPFPDLETFLATVGGGATLLAIAGGLAGFAAAVVARPAGPVVGVLAGGAGVGIPATTVLLSLDTPFPLVSAAAAVAGGLGAFALAVQATALARTNPSVEPD